MVDTVASLQAVIGADVSGLDSGLATAETKLTSFGDKIKNVGASVMGAGAQITALTAPIGLAFGVGLNTAMQFEDVMTEIGARADLTSDELSNLSDFALQMGADTAFSGQQAADALLQLMTSGSSAEEAMSILPSVLDAAAASGADLGSTADTVTDIMAAFGLGTEDAASIVDSLAKASGSSSADMVALADGFQNAGGKASAFGLNVDQTAAALAVLNENGIKGAQAGTQLGSMLTNMTGNTADTKRAWDELGLSMYDSQGNMNDLEDVLTEMKFKLEDMPVQEQNRLMMDLAGAYGFNALKALTSANGITEMRDAMENAASAGDIADARMNTFSGSLDSLKGSFDTLMITALTPFMEDHLKPMVTNLTEVVNSVTDWVDENPELTAQIITLAAGAAVLGPIIVGLGAVISGFGTIVKFATGPLGLMAIAIGAIALTDWEMLSDGINQVGDGLDKIANGDLGDGLNDVATGAGTAIESTFIGQLANGLIDIADQAGVLDAIGLEAVNVSEGFAAWGFAIESAVTLIGVGLDDIKRGFDRFGLDIQLSIAGFLLSIEQALQGTPFEVDWGMENVVADLQDQIAQHDINGAIHDALGAQLGSGAIDLGAMIEIEAPDGSIITMPLGQAIESADMSYFSERTKIRVRSALEQAIAEGDLSEVTVLNDAAIELGIAVEDLQPDIQALRDDVVSEIEAQDYSASVTANVTITAFASSVNSDGLWAAMQNSFNGGGAGGQVTVNNYTTNVQGSMLGSEEAASVVADGRANGPQ